MKKKLVIKIIASTFELISKTITEKARMLCVVETESLIKRKLLKVKTP